MRILKNVTKQELDYYTAQPTAKAMHERIMKDSLYIPEGDKSAAAVYISERDAQRAAKTDKVEISSLGQKLNKATATKSNDIVNEDTPNITFSAERIGETNRFFISFDNSAMVHRAVKQGFLEIEGKQVELSDDVKKQLLAANKQIQDVKKRVFTHNMLLHEAANARQSSDGMKEANDKMSRAMTTASRIMRGRKVSPADEKELMEFNKDLYAMAKSAEALAKHRRKQDDKEDEKISADNDKARAREAEPKDYSVEETPIPQTKVQIEVSFDADIPEVILFSNKK